MIATNHNVRPINTPREDLSQGVNRVASEFGGILALHGELLGQEVEQWRRETTWARMAVTISVGILIAAATAALGGLAAALYEHFALSVSASLAIASFVGWVVAAVLWKSGWRAINDHPAPFQRTSQEFRRNVRCLFEVGDSSSTPAGHR